MVFFVLLVCGITASANFSDFSDVSGHWAETNLEKAYQDGFLVGFEDNTMRPDAPISEAEVLAILCRVLDAQNWTDVSSLGLSGTEWYADAATKAASMNLISDGSRLQNESLSRSDAFLLLSKAFQLTEAAPEEEPLQAFTDSKLLNRDERRCVLSLIHWGGLQGYEDHTLRLKDTISRAEFISMLYRIVPYRKNASEIKGSMNASILISDQAQLKNQTFAFPVYLDCSVKNISLRGVTANLIVVRSQKTDEITVSSGSQVNVLSLSGGTGNSSNINPTGSSHIETIVVGDRSGKLTVSGNVSRLEVVGNGQTVTINTALDELVVSSVGSQISLTSSGSIRSLRLTEDSSSNTIYLDKTANLLLDGNNNTVSATGSVESLSLYGSKNQLTGTGEVMNASIYTTRSVVSLSCHETIDKTDHGITEVSLLLSAPETLAIGDTLTVTAHLQNAEKKRCKAQWIIGGTVVKEEFINIGPQSSTVTYSSNFNYTETMNTNFQVLFQLLYTTKDGIEQTASTSAATILENYSPEYYQYYSNEAVFSRVTTGYNGNYTLSWAQNNDYDELTKTIWVNSKNYSSKTNYLIWISISQQRVNIFEGTQGHWSLIKCFLVGTGAKGTDTPVGVYTVGTRTYTGWTTDTYNVRPVVRFKMGSGLAFHSRIYDPQYTRITDGSIGYPVSHGCIRMYDEDVWWIYDTIPQYTTVVVY
jgi:lipoprotein-anchoring transpeptidase ErfK/SrfK